jgi:hypothetical protein
VHVQRFKEYFVVFFLVKTVAVEKMVCHCALLALLMSFTTHTQPFLNSFTIHTDETNRRPFKRSAKRPDMHLFAAKFQYLEQGGDKE